MRALAFLYESKVTPTQRRTLCESSRSRLADLLKARSWWSAARPRVSWRTILDRHWCVVVNTGVTASGQIAGEQTAQLMAAMLTYALRAAIMATCSSWRAQGRSHRNRGGHRGPFGMKGRTNPGHRRRAGG